MTQQGYRLVWLEQTTDITRLHRHTFTRKTVQVVANARLGISDEVLGLVCEAVEIPVWGSPHSRDSATAANTAV